MAGILYTVKSKGETPATIAKKYEVDAKKCALEFSEKNGLGLKSGDKILITAGFLGSDESSRKYFDSNLMKIDII